MLVPWLILVLVSLAAGWLIHIILRRFSNQAGLRQVKRRKKAWLYELRMYVDEPSLIGRAQIALIRDNLRHVTILLKPLLVLTPLMLLVYVGLDGIHGRHPLIPGNAATLTVHLAPPFPDAAPGLEVPDGVGVETPPVRIPASNEVSWRIRPMKTVSGSLRIRLAQETVEYPIRAGTGPLFRMPWPLQSQRVEAIDIPYPDAGWAWIFWLTAISLATVLVLNHRAGVSL